MHLPAVDVGKDLLCSSFTVDPVEILHHPVHEIVLESPFDDLMEYVW
jgi:hypothetical protein